MMRALLARDSRNPELTEHPDDLKRVQAAALKFESLYHPHVLQPATLWRDGRLPWLTYQAPPHFNGYTSSSSAEVVPMDIELPSGRSWRFVVDIARLDRPHADSTINMDRIHTVVIRIEPLNLETEPIENPLHAGRRIFQRRDPHLLAPAEHRPGRSSPSSNASRDVHLDRVSLNITVAPTAGVMARSLASD